MKGMRFQISEWSPTNKTEDVCAVLRTLHKTGALVPSDSPWPLFSGNSQFVIIPDGDLEPFQIESSGSYLAKLIRKRKCRWSGHKLRKDGASEGFSRKERKRETKKQLEELHSERSWKKLE
jgi:hypothetical protein